MKKMQHCFWCGEELGIYDNFGWRFEHCQNQKCAEEARHAELSEQEELRHRAEDDEYERYRY